MVGKKEMKKSDKLRIDLISTIVVTLIALAVTVAAVISMAWFASNKETTGEGMGVSVSGPPYSIIFADSAIRGSFTDVYDFVKGENSIEWMVTNESNMLNYSTAQGGLHPGCNGVISFYVKPGVEEVDLKFNFEIFGYAFERDENGQLLAGNANLLKPISTDTAVHKYLNGHIILFGERVQDGNEYKYSEPLIFDENHVRTNGTFRKFLKSDGTTDKNRVDIYWVWPKTLDEIVDNNAAGVITLDDEAANDDAYDVLTGDFCNNLGYYLKCDRPDELSGLTLQTILDRYTRYADFYDRADNDIGEGVHYISIKMTVLDNTEGQ